MLNQNKTIKVFFNYADKYIMKYMTSTQQPNELYTVAKFSSDKSTNSLVILLVIFALASLRRGT